MLCCVIYEWDICVCVMYPHTLTAVVCVGGAELAFIQDSCSRSVNTQWRVYQLSGAALLVRYASTQLKANRWRCSLQDWTTGS